MSGSEHWKSIWEMISIDGGMSAHVHVDAGE